MTRFLLAALLALAAPAAAFAQAEPVKPVERSDLVPLVAPPAAHGVDEGEMGEGPVSPLWRPLSELAARVMLPGALAAGDETARDIGAAEGEKVRAEPAGSERASAPKRGVPKPSHPLAPVGAGIGAVLDGLGSPVKPDEIRLEIENRSVTIPVPRAE